MRLDGAFILESMPLLLTGALVSIVLVILSTLIGCAIGLVVCFGKLYGVGPARQLSRLYVTVVRGIPEIVVMFWIYYCAPLLFHVRPSGFAAATVAMGLYAGAMLAEVFRAGILAVPDGQHKAAQALALSPFWTWWAVIGPQAFRAMIPALLGVLSLQIKISGMASAIGVGELVYTANILGGQTYRYFDLYTTIGAMYFVIVFIISLAARQCEARLRSHGG
jgi:His/Glu/Gln/Arg/opine family amino acid ABC transporter permease subunit